MEINKAVVFQVDNEQYAVPVENVISIEKMSSPTLIPQMPDYMLGVVRIRGELVPVLDTMKILYRRSYTETEKTRMIVVITEDLSVALIVDDAKEIIAIPKEAIKQINLLAYRQTPYFIGVASLDGVNAIKEHIQSHQ
jgi:purine-binding chemotaxis protein CheW